MRKTLIFLLIILSLYLSFPNHILAASQQFSTNIISTYTVNSKGETAVDQRITLTNKTTDYYATEYNLFLEGDKIENISARDNQGNILKTIQKISNKTKIDLKFNEKIIGKDKNLTFRVSYQSNKLAKKQGIIWKIQIPPKPESDNIVSYSAVLKVPDEFAGQVYFKPTPSKAKTKEFIWKDSALSSTGAIAYFGNSQYYLAKLSYYLNNNSSTAKQKSVALPPDTANQKILIKNINPKPDNIEVDSDGNWLAIYTLSPKTSLNITSQLGIQTFLSPRKDYNPKLNSTDQKAYLATKQYWESNNSQIKEIASDLKSARAIYRYVANNLSYNYKRLEEEPKRFGAVGSLDNKTNAVCTEYTDLFIALARAAGIPARELNGYAFTEDSTIKPLSLIQDILHAWPEYYDFNNNIWKPIDPTWASTTGGVDYFSILDFDHIVFVIHGLSSTEPLPAGYYKKNNQQEAKDIQVSFVDNLPIETNKPIAIEIELPDKIFIKKEIIGYIKLSNPNNIAVYNIKPKITSNPLKLTTKIEGINIIPPFASYLMPINLSYSSDFSWANLLKKGYFKHTNKLQIELNGQTVTKTSAIFPQEIKYLQIGIIIFLSSALLIAAVFIVKQKL